MKKWLRTLIIILLIALVSLLVIVLVSNYFIKQKVENFLETRLPNHISQSHSGIQLDSFEGTITINQPVIEVRNVADNILHTTVDFEKIIVEDVSYWDYIFHSNIHIEAIKVVQPNIVYYQEVFQQHKKQDTTSGLVDIYKPFIIDELQIEKATLHIYDKSKDSLLMSVKNAGVGVQAITISDKTILNKIPLDFKDYKFVADSLFLKANAFENLATSKVEINSNHAIIRDIQFKTKYSRKAMSQIIKKERDHFDLQIDSLNINKVDFGFSGQNLFVKANTVALNAPNLDIFRDKLVADDLEEKQLYSAMIRELPFNLTVDAVTVHDAAITYTEKVKTDNNGGSIEFSNFNAAIANVSNTYASPTKTTLDISGDFMKNTAFNASWSFDVNDTSDSFIFKMDMKTLEFPRINEFTAPNLKVRFKGKVNQLYYTIDGNNAQSTVDMKVDYTDLEINVLNKNGREKNRFLSAVANLFVSKDSKDKSDDFRKAKTDVERDKTKSVFNFIWLNTRKGLLKSMAGDGEKK